MTESRFQNNWIHFEGTKYTIKDFIDKHQFSSEESIRTIVNFIKDWQSATSYILQKTSGSTGKPKTIKISKSQIKASALATLETLDLKVGENALLCINPEYIGGKMMIARSLIGELNLSIAPIIGNPLKDYPTHETIDFFSFVPYQFEKILEESPSKIPFLNNAKAIILGGAPVSESLAERIKKNFNITKVYSTYGMTETVSHVALKLINSDENEAFKALKNIRFSTDERNCLIIHAPEISGQNQLITNDVVNLISSTEFHWLGRYDYVINSGGIKLHPEILEKEIEVIFEKNHIDKQFFVFGLPDEKLGESLNLLVEGSIDNGQLQKLFKENLPAFHAPKKIFSIKQFTKTESGKINRLRTIEKIGKLK
ncbi:AMP-binding protein [Marivirga tractuosa]|uniref:AMP-binding protein n=1 Tax=Marivirga tractuosa TaxID=1006 RepID=UPI0035CFA817